jgi:hypothetical protein
MISPHPHQAPLQAPAEAPAGHRPAPFGAGRGLKFLVQIELAPETRVTAPFPSLEERLRWLAEGLFRASTAGPEPRVTVIRWEVP